MAALYKHRVTLTDTHTHIVVVIVGVEGITFQPAEQISYEPVLKIRS